MNMQVSYFGCIDHCCRVGLRVVTARSSSRLVTSDQLQNKHLQMNCQSLPQKTAVAPGYTYAAAQPAFHFKYDITQIALSQCDGTRKVLFILEKTLSGNTNSAWPHLSII